jgi:hypothetical protein
VQPHLVRPGDPSSLPSAPGTLRVLDSASRVEWKADPSGLKLQGLAGATDFNAALEAYLVGGESEPLSCGYRTQVTVANGNRCICIRVRLWHGQRATERPDSKMQKALPRERSFLKRCRQFFLR